MQQDRGEALAIGGEVGIGAVADSGDPHERRHRHLDQAFAEEKLDGLRLASRLRLAAVAVVMAYDTVFRLAAGPLGWVYFGEMAALALIWLLGEARYRLVRRHIDHPLIMGCFPVLDAVVLALLIVLPPTMVHGAPAPYLQYDRPFIWFVLLLVLNGLAYRPWLAVWSGIAIAAVWLGVMAWMLRTPGSHLGLSPQDWHAMLEARDFAPITDPLLVRSWAWEFETIVAILVGAMLAAMVARSQRLIRRTVTAERARSNLARFFSPGMVDRLETLEELERPQTATIGVIFADIVAFTRFAEEHTADEVITLMREFRSRMSGAVFAQDGTLDKFIGDAVMATFGTPVRHGREALRTLASAVAMADTIAAWNRDRAEARLPPVHIGIGAHYGPVVMGGIGDERRLEFAVLGDTVNVASRLEELTRAVDGEIVISDDLAAAALADDADAAEPLLSGFAPLPLHPLRGRGEAIGLQVRQRIA